MPDDVAASLRDGAARNYRSLSGEVRAALDEHLTRELARGGLDRTAGREGEVRG